VIDLLTHPTRERREHAVFKALLRIVPNLEDRIMAGSEDDLTEIADSVSSSHYILVHFISLCSFVKGHPAPGATTRNLSREIF
jgi:hypothetical protein